MNKKFTEHENKSSAVTAENIVHEPHPLEKLMKQNQDTLEMMGNLMRLMVEKLKYLALFFVPGCPSSGTQFNWFR